MNLLPKRFQKAQSEIVVTVNTEVSESERAQQPAAGSSLMIRAVALRWDGATGQPSYERQICAASDAESSKRMQKE